MSEPAQIIERDAAHVGLFFRSHCERRITKFIGSACFDFDEHKDVAFARDKIDFSVAAAISA